MSITGTEMVWITVAATCGLPVTQRTCKIAANIKGARLDIRESIFINSVENGSVVLLLITRKYILAYSKQKKMPLKPKI